MQVAPPGLEGQSEAAHDRASSPPAAASASDARLAQLGRGHVPAVEVQDAYLRCHLIAYLVGGAERVVAEGRGVGHLQPAVGMLEGMVAELLCSAPVRAKDRDAVLMVGKTGSL